MKPTFCLQKLDHTPREQLAVINFATSLGLDYTFAKECQPGAIPIGSVEFCEPAFGKQPTLKDFYPDFLLRFVTRSISPLRTAGGYWRQSERFIKCARHWKCETKSKVYIPGDHLPPGVWWQSDVVRFVNEWRYYVADGELITTGWYDGDDEANDDLPAPKLDIKWPDGFSGAIDFGELEDGRIELVEAHAPFACGWYGDDHELYVMWQEIAWESADFWRV